MINLTETGVFPLELYSTALVHSFFCPGRMVIWLGQRSPTGHRRQGLIDAE